MFFILSLSLKTVSDRTAGGDRSEGTIRCKEKEKKSIFVIILFWLFNSQTNEKSAKDAGSSYSRFALLIVGYSIIFFFRYWVSNHPRRGLYTSRRTSSSKKYWGLYLDEPSSISWDFSFSKECDVYPYVPCFITTYGQVISAYSTIC